MRSPTTSCRDTASPPPSGSRRPALPQHGHPSCRPPTVASTTICRHRANAPPKPNGSHPRRGCESIPRRQARSLRIEFSTLKGDPRKIHLPFRRDRCGNDGMSFYPDPACPKDSQPRRVGKIAEHRVWACKSRCGDLAHAGRRRVRPSGQNRHHRRRKHNRRRQRFCPPYESCRAFLSVALGLAAQQFPSLREERLAAGGLGW